jgi:ribosomal protein S11
LTVSSTASSGLPVSFTLVPNGNCSLSGSVVTLLNTGNCGVVASQAGNTIYAAAPAVGQVIVVNATQMPQTITFKAIPAQKVGTTLTVSATASSGLPVSFTLVPNGNCSLSGSAVTLLNTGNCGVIASQSGNASYTAATMVGQVIVVTN